jgi:hypothetical protein
MSRALGHGLVLWLPGFVGYNPSDAGVLLAFFEQVFCLYGLPVFFAQAAKF